jgi:putative ABC transport system permease protein
MAKKQFGTTDALGKVIMMKQDSAFVPYKVTAVADRIPQNSSIHFDVLLPFKVRDNGGAKDEDWFNFFLNTFVVLNPNANIQQVEASMQKFYLSDSKEALANLTERLGDVFGSSRYFLQPFTNMHLSTELPAQNGLSDASNPMYSYILSGIALFILLIACINFINLTIARSVKRAKEIGIRKVVGGDRKQLIAQFLGESILLCLLAFLLAFLIVQVSLPVFNDLANKKLALSYLFDAKLVIGFSLLFAITAFLAGFYPALVLSGYNPVQILYSRFTLGGKNYLQK